MIFEAEFEFRRPLSPSGERIKKHSVLSRAGISLTTSEERYMRLRSSSSDAIIPRKNIFAKHVMKTLKSAFVLSLLVASVVGATGCSWFSSGSGESEDGGLSEADLAAQREGRFGAGNIPTAEGEGMFRDVHFGYDSYALEGAARNDVEANAKVLSEQSGMKIVLEGHCDERGTVEYNMALGAERARAVKSALIALGVPSSRIDTISYGEEIPLDPGHSEDAYAKNRRVHFSVGSAAPATEKGSRY